MIQLSFPTKKLKEYIKRANIKLKDTNYNQNDLTVYGVTNTEGITITGNQTSEDLGNYIVLKENQLAYNPYRVNVGSIGLASKGLVGLVSPAYIVFETTEELSAEFLYYYLKSSLGINLIKWYGDRGGVRSALRYNDLCDIDIPDLTLSQQICFLNKMKEVSEEIEVFGNEVHYQEQLITKLRQSILQEAVQGKLVPQDPNDEPASVLLEKIKEEKERLIKEKKIKKEKPLPHITEDEIPYELPNGWEWVRLGDIAIINPRNDIDGDVEVSFIPMKLIEDGFSNKHSSETKKWKDVKCGFTHFQESDVVIAKITPCFQNRKSAVMKKLTNGYGAGTTELYVVRNYANTVLPKYLLALFKTEAFIQGGVATYTGTAGQQRVKKDYIVNLLFPLPPLNEQKRIVEKIDQLMALCDELEKNIEKSKKDSELLMQSVLQEAFKEA